MYFVATLHPNLVEDKGLFFTQTEKEKQIRDFYEKKQVIPLCIDHCGADTCGFIVPEKERIGYVVDLFNNKKGELMVKLRLDGSHPAYKLIHQGMQLRRERWGVSVWIECDYNTRLKQMNKSLTHVALTTDPLFAKHNTFLHQFSFDEHPLDRIIAQHYYDEQNPQCYASPQLKQKIKGMREIEVLHNN